MPKKAENSENYFVVAGAIVLGILLLYAVAVFKAPIQDTGIEFTSILHRQMQGGQTEFSFSIMIAGR